jgi:transcriptional regulator with XRE-family HTH domain
MDIRQALGAALKSARRARGLTQEDFGCISSRTYLSTLERGLKSPTLDKIQAISDVLGVHPLTLLSMAYMQRDSQSAKQLLDSVADELGRCLGK